MVRYRKKKRGSGLNPGESPADVGKKAAKDAGEYVKSGINQVGYILKEAALTGGKKKYKKRRQRGGNIVASQTTEGLPGIPIGKEFCDKNIKKGGGKNEFSKCGGDVFKGLYGGSKKKSRRSTKMRRTRRRRGSSRHKRVQQRR